MNQELKDRRINDLIALFTKGQIEQCISQGKKVLKMYPNEPFLFNILGITHAAKGLLAESLNYYEKAIDLNPSYFEVFNNMGVAYNDWKKPKEAISCLKKAIGIQPTYAEAFNNIGNSYKELSDFDNAVISYKKAIDLAPTYTDALCNLGICWSLQEKYEQAEATYKKALEIDPGNTGIYDHLINNLLERKLYTDAKEVISNFIDKGINIAKAFNYLGLYHTATQTDDFSEAIKCFENSINEDPNFDDPYVSLGTIFMDQRKFKKSLEYFKKALQLNKFNDQANYAQVRPLIFLGELKRGWECYEYRWKVSLEKNVKWPIEGKLLWEGKRDSAIVLWREQGIGDELIFLGLVPEAQELSKSVSVYIDKRLIPLCERSMPDVRFLSDPEQIGEQEFDYHLPMGSLPRLFRSSEEDFEKTVKGYLKADADRVEVLRQELNVGDRKIIGISWKSIKSLNQLKKSLTLMEFGKIFQDLDVVLLNLQYGEVDEEIKAFERDTGIEIIQCASVDNREDLDGLAALIELCDLVVSTSNVTIHLAGALGKDTWVLLPYVANFWWLLERTDSVWYPSLTLYRQKTLKDWDSVALDLKEDLKKKFNM